MIQGGMKIRDIYPVGRAPRYRSRIKKNNRSDRKIRKLIGFMQEKIGRRGLYVQGASTGRRERKE